MEIWTKKKPKLTGECVLLTANKIRDRWYYAAFTIIPQEVDEKWYYAICDSNGDEWGDYSDLKADSYFVIQPPKAK